MTKKKPGKHLRFYMDCMNNGMKMPDTIPSPYKGGLCRAVDNGLLSEHIFKFFSAEQNKFHYWADEGDNDYGNRFEFNVLRQNIVLFMAAINDEL